MTTESDTARRIEPDDPDPTPTVPAVSTDLAADHSRAWIVGSVLVGVILVTWFFVSWLAMGRQAVDAAGESIGSAFVLLLIVTLVGAVRGRT